jgi:hypothetical protein
MSTRVVIVRPFSANDAVSADEDGAQQWVLLVHAGVEQRDGGCVRCGRMKATDEIDYEVAM